MNQVARGANTDQAGRQASRQAGRQGIRTNVSEKAAAGGLCPADPGGPNIGLR